MPGEILPVTVHGSPVKMYPEKFPGVILTAFVKIRLSTVEKDMITATQGKMGVLDADSTAAR